MSAFHSLARITFFQFAECSAHTDKRQAGRAGRDRRQDVGAYMRSKARPDKDFFFRSREQAYQEYLLKTTATEDKMRAVMVAIIEKQKIMLVNGSIDLLT